jgi:cell wall-associated protease
MIKGLKRWSLVLAVIAYHLVAFGQGKSTQQGLPRSWYQLDLERDGVFGISLDKAYDFIKEKNLKSHTVVVGVIDSGVDTTQEDLRGILWTNPKEIPGNGVDDDHNGYVDDIHGWNFLGGKDGSNVSDDAGEEGRVYYRFKDKFGDKDFNAATLSGDDLDDYNMWLQAKKKITSEATQSDVEIITEKRIVRKCFEYDSLLQKAMGKTDYTGYDLDGFVPTTIEAKSAKSILLLMFRESKVMYMTNAVFLSELKEEVERDERKSDIKENAPEEYRKEIVKDNELDSSDKYYGNNDVTACDPMHGTHVSGIIGAVRNNGIGINGIADNVRIMMVRALPPNGDEHDKDISLAIRYAVDNGAKVINMSFGKNLSPQKRWVDAAVQYAQSRGVLLVLAAGNDNANMDSVKDFPNPHFKDSKLAATNWITVGASSDPLAEDDFKSYTASFSNYGKNEVDVFAPGTRIYSTLPRGNKYGSVDGTSMAAPIVTGIAALVMEYFPDLTAQQVKYCIEKSAVPPPGKVKKPGSSDEMVDLSEICKSGGIVNAYGSIKLAYELSAQTGKK